MISFRMSIKQYLFNEKCFSGIVYLQNLFVSFIVHLLPVSPGWSVQSFVLL